MPFKNTRVTIKFYEEFVVALKIMANLGYHCQEIGSSLKCWLTGKEIEIWIDYDKLALNRHWLETAVS